tara:strand:- start:494 stop:1090 length:597 start_codon:yes stop_codon:yes gene_type:complete
MAMAIGILSYQYYSSNSNLELYKERYKELAILYLNEVMKAPELLPPISNDDETKKIDFSYNTLQFENLENESFRIQDFKDKILFINIWATWCNPCLAEMPSMVELYENYKDDERIEFLYLSREKMNVIKNFIPNDENLQKLPLYKITSDDEFFATKAIPTTFILNRQGVIVVEDVGSAYWNDRSVIEYLNNLLAINEI